MSAAKRNALKSELNRGQPDQVGISSEIENGLIKKIQDSDDEVSKKILLQAYEKFIRKKSNYIARRFKVDPEEAYQEAVMGFFAAVQKFDPEKGARISTYSGHWIDEYLRQYTYRSFNSNIEIPVVVAQKLTQYIRYINENNLDATSLTKQQKADIQEKFGLSAQAFERARSVTSKGSYRSFDDSIHADGNLKLADVIADDRDNAFEIVDQQKLKRLVRVFIMHANLKDREREIIERRTLSADPETLEDLSSKFNITRERVRQIEVMALGKVKKAAIIHMRRMGLSDGEPSFRDFCID